MFELIPVLAVAVIVFMLFKKTRRRRKAIELSKFKKTDEPLDDKMDIVDEHILKTMDFQYVK